MTAASAPSAPAGRYSTGAIVLHWVIAAAIIVQIGMGWWMEELDGAPLHRTVEQAHISLGLTVLLLTIARLAWRLSHRPPPLSADFPKLDHRAANVVHVLFYVLMFALPLSGWMMESFGPRPVPFWGLEWPHFPGMPAMVQEMNPRELKEAIEDIHGSPMVWSMIALIVLHVAGALKHQFDGHPILWRMTGRRAS